MSEIICTFPTRLNAVSQTALRGSMAARFPATITTGFGGNPYLLIPQLNAWFPEQTLVIAPSKNKPLPQLACDALLRAQPEKGNLALAAYQCGGVFLKEAVRRNFQ